MWIILPVGTESSSSLFPQHRRRFLKWEANGDEGPWKVILSCDRAERGKHIFRSAAFFFFFSGNLSYWIFSDTVTVREIWWVSATQGSGFKRTKTQSEFRTVDQTRRLSKEAKDINHINHNLSTESNASNQDSVRHFHAWILYVEH